MTRSERSIARGRRISGRAQNDDIEDPYRMRKKLSEPTFCRQCGAVWHRGRWQWGAKPAGAESALCSACRRIEDRLPAGRVTIPRDFVTDRLVEIVGLLRNEEREEKQEHPLNRIIDIEETTDALIVHTTDIHLPRRLGEALKRAFHGELNMHFDEAGYFVRVDWSPSPR